MNFYKTLSGVLLLTISLQSQAMFRSLASKLATRMPVASMMRNAKLAMPKITQRTFATAKSVAKSALAKPMLARAAALGGLGTMMAASITAAKAEGMKRESLGESIKEIEALGELANPDIRWILFKAKLKGTYNAPKDEEAWMKISKLKDDYNQCMQEELANRNHEEANQKCKSLYQLIYGEKYPADHQRPYLFTPFLWKTPIINDIRDTVDEATKITIAAKENGWELDADFKRDAEVGIGGIANGVPKLHCWNQEDFVFVKVFNKEYAKCVKDNLDTLPFCKMLFKKCQRDPLDPNSRFVGNIQEYSFDIEFSKNPSSERTK